MKKLALGLALLLAATISVPLSARAEAPTLAAMVGQSGSGSLQVNLTWTAPGCAAAIVTNAGVETAGPCYGIVFRVPVTTGSACPAFSPTAYTSVTTTDPILSTAGSYSDTTVAAGSTYCYAVEDAFQAGGAASSPSNTFQIFAILLGTPGTPSGLTGVTAQ